MRSIGVSKLVCFATQIAPNEKQKTWELLSTYQQNHLGNLNLWQ